MIATHYFWFQTMPSDPVEAEKLELKKMRTLERRAKMSELQRLRKAQVSVSLCVTKTHSSSLFLFLNSFFNFTS